MLCPECKVEARITKVRQVFNTEEQKLYRLVDFTCYNKKCPKCNEVVGQAKDELPVTIE